MNIEELIHKYFEGETTSEEERELQHFFTRGIVPEQLQSYRPMFAYFDSEKKEREKSVARTPERSERPIGRYIFCTLSGIAVGWVLLLGIAGIYRQQTPTVENYVLIDGQKYTDSQFVREQALEALHEVSLTKEEVFSTLFEE